MCKKNMQKKRKKTQINANCSSKTLQRRGTKWTAPAHISSRLYRSQSHFPSTTSLFLWPWRKNIATRRGRGGEGREGRYRWWKWLWRRTGHRSAPGTWAWRWSCQWSRWRPPGRWGPSVSTRCCWRAVSEMEWNLVEDTQQKFNPLESEYNIPNVSETLLDLVVVDRRCRTQFYRLGRSWLMFKHIKPENYCQISCVLKAKKQLGATYCGS